MERAMSRVSLVRTTTLPSVPDDLSAARPVRTNRSSGLKTMLVSGLFETRPSRTAVGFFNAFGFHTCSLASVPPSKRVKGREGTDS